VPTALGSGYGKVRRLPWEHAMASKTESRVARGDGRTGFGGEGRPPERGGRWMGTGQAMGKDRGEEKKGTLSRGKDPPATATHQGNENGRPPTRGGCSGARSTNRNESSKSSQTSAGRGGNLMGSRVREQDD